MFNMSYLFITNTSSSKRTAAYSNSWKIWILSVLFIGLGFEASSISNFPLPTDPIRWTTQFETAKTTAQAANKRILMVFAGSDWCAPCKKLKKHILLTEEFMNFEKENLVILYLDFPSRKKNKLSKDQTEHNESLASEYNQSGSFPKVVLLSSLGEKIVDIKYEGQKTDKFINEIKSSL